MEASAHTLASFNSAWIRIERLYSSWARRRGVNGLEDTVLYALKETGLTSQKEIADSVGLPKQSVSSVVASLASRGMVQMQQDPHDRRAKRITLTEQGILYANELVSPTVQCESNALAAIGNEDAEQLMRLFEKYYGALKAQMDNYARDHSLGGTHPA